MQTFSQPATYRFLRAFWDITRKLRSCIGPLAKERHHLELAEFFLLDHVSRSNLPPGKIAAEMEIPAHAVSRKLEALERLGFMTRALDPGDNRRRVLSITSEGENALTDTRATLHREVAQLLVHNHSDYSAKGLSSSQAALLRARRKPRQGRS